MPSWEIHLAIANDLMKKIVVEPNCFLIGNLIPDAERYVIKDFSIFVPYRISHYAEKQQVGNGWETLPNVEKFFEYHEKDKKNCMLLGYASHLLADYYWNKLTAERYTIRDEDGNCIGILKNDGSRIQGSKEDRAFMKREDFDIFNQNLVKHKKMSLPEIDEKVMEELKIIKEVPFVKEDIEKIMMYLKNNREKLFHSNETKEYQLYSKEQIEEDYQNCLQYILESLKKYTSS